MHQQGTSYHHHLGTGNLQVKNGFDSFIHSAHIHQRLESSVVPPVDLHRSTSIISAVAASSTNGLTRSGS